MTYNPIQYIMKRTHDFMTKMVTVAETPSFKNLVDDYFDPQSFEVFKEHIARNPTDGDLIKDSQGVRKVRWARPGSGKSRSYRVLTCYDEATDTVWLLTLYAKSETSTIKGSAAKKLKP